jgi:hypothetical protein
VFSDFAQNFVVCYCAQNIFFLKEKKVLSFGFPPPFLKKKPLITLSESEER